LRLIAGLVADEYIPLPMKQQSDDASYSNAEIAPSDDRIWRNTDPVELRGLETHAKEIAHDVVSTVEYVIRKAADHIPGGAAS